MTRHAVTHRQSTPEHTPEQRRQRFGRLADHYIARADGRLIVKGDAPHVEELRRMGESARRIAEDSMR